MGSARPFNAGQFYLELGQLNQQNNEILAESFNNLPPNPYADGNFRLRRFSHFTFKNNTLSHLPQKDFVQSQELNAFQGGVVRRYEEIEDGLINNDAFKEMFFHFKNMAHLDDNADIEVHQIRIKAKQGKEADVAPEGVHQDGFDRIGIFVIRREHLKAGGNLRIHLEKESEPFISHKFDHGEFVVLNDKRFWHSAAKILPEEGHEGYMDVFVLTA
jgi:hypothetical protein